MPVSVGFVANTFLVYAGLLISFFVALVVAIMPPRVLEVSVRESIIAVIGEEGLDEARRAMQSAISKSDITIPQKRILQALGALLGVPVAVLLLFFASPWLALGAGFAISLLGFFNKTV